MHWRDIVMVIIGCVEWNLTARSLCAEDVGPPHSPFLYCVIYRVDPLHASELRWLLQLFLLASSP